MQKYIDIATQAVLSEGDVKRRVMSVPIIATKTDWVTPDVVPQYDEAGELIEQPDPEPVEVTRERRVTRTISRLDDVNASDLATANVARVEYIETPPPVIEPWQKLLEGELDKSESGIWRTTWVVESPSVADAVVQRKAAIERERDALINAEDATVTLTDGRVFQTDPRSVTLMNRAKSNADLNGGFAPGAIWRDADNINHPRTTALFAEISAKEEARCEPIWYLSWTLKAQVDAIAADAALTDAEKVAAIMAQTWAEPAPE